MPQYDYIITGAGCAGLSLLMRMISDGNFSSSSILVVDQSPKTLNDRTWCYWEEGAGFFEALVYRHWETLWFHAHGISRRMDIAPFNYKMIRGIDFYTHCFDVIAKQPNVTVLYGHVDQISTTETMASITVNGTSFSAPYLFNSILFEKPVGTPGNIMLLQHFKGWIVQANKAVFQEGEATLMDFRTSQQQGAAFVYVMPFSQTRALVEYTLFSEQLLEQAAYDEGLRTYLKDIAGLDSYQVEESEFGIIPMTSQRFPRRDKRIMYIGTAGGQTKASSGYTFQFIQKQSERIVQGLREQGSPFYNRSEKRFSFYDQVLLRVLHNRQLPGDQLFAALFGKNKTGDLFPFLDNESTPAQEFRIIATLPVWPFARAAAQQLWSAIRRVLHMPIR